MVQSFNYPVDTLGYNTSFLTIKANVLRCGEDYEVTMTVNFREKWVYVIGLSMIKCSKKYPPGEENDETQFENDYSDFDYVEVDTGGATLSNDDLRKRIKDAREALPLMYNKTSSFAIPKKKVEILKMMELIEIKTEKDYLDLVNEIIKVEDYGWRYWSTVARKALQVGYSILNRTIEKFFKYGSLSSRTGWTYDDIRILLDVGNRAFNMKLEQLTNHRPNPTGAPKTDVDPQQETIDYPDYNDFDLVYKKRKAIIEDIRFLKLDILKLAGIMRTRTNDSNHYHSMGGVLKGSTSRFPYKMIVERIGVIFPGNLANETLTMFNKTGIVLINLKDNFLWARSPDSSQKAAYLGMGSLEYPYLVTNTTTPFLWEVPYQFDFQSYTSGHLRMSDFLDKNKSIAEESLGLHELFVEHPMTAMAVFIDNVREEDVFKMVVRLNRRPKVEEFFRNDTFVYVHDTYATFVPLEASPGSRIYLALMPNESLGKRYNKYKTITYKLVVARLECKYISEKDRTVDSRVPVSRCPNDQSFYCSSTKTGLYQFSQTKIRSRFIQEESVNPPELPLNFIPCITVGVLVFVYLVALISKKIHRSSGVITKKMQMLMDNNLLDEVPYVLVVTTGASTTANIAFQLHGAEASTPVHLFRGQSEPVLQSNADDWFYLLTDKDLGPLKSIDLWSDCYGFESSWFCAKIKVINQTTNQEWLFQINDWLSPIDGRTFRTVDVETPAEVFYFQRHVYAARALGNHLWVKTFTRLQGPIFTFNERIHVLFSIFATNMMIVMLVLYFNPPDVSRIDFGMYEILIGCGTGVVTFIYTSVLIYFFTNSGRCGSNPTPTPGRTPEPIIAPGRTPETITTPEATSKTIPTPETTPETIPTPETTPETIPASETTAETIPVPGTIPETISETTPKEIRHTTRCRIISWLFMVFLLLGSIGTVIGLGLFIHFVTSILWLCIIPIGLLVCIILECFRVMIIGFISREVISPILTINRKSIEIQRDKIKRGLGDNGMRFILQKFYSRLSDEEVKEREKSAREIKLLRFEKSEYILYFLYFVILFAIVMCDRDPLSYISANNIRDVFIEDKYIRKIQLNEINSQKRFYRYMQQVFLPAIHATKWYGSYGSRAPGRLIDFNSRMVGVARIRQTRVQNGTCQVPKHFQHLVEECHGEYNIFAEDTATYGEFWKPYNESQERFASDESWYYKSWMTLKTVPFIGELGVYPGGGYSIKFGRTWSNSRIIIRYIKNTRWIDERTRALFLDVNLYNINSNLFNFLTIAIEQSATGAFLTNYQLHTLRLFHHADATSMVLPFLWLSLFGFLVAFSWSKYIQCTEFYASSFRGLVSNLWNAVDLVIILLISSALVTQSIKYLIVESILRGAKLSDNNFVSYVDVIICQKTVEVLIALLITFSTIRLWKLLRFLRQFQLLELTLKFSAKYLLSMMIINVLLILVYAVVGFLMLGPYVKEFRTVWSSFLALMLISFGLEFNLGLDTTHQTMYTYVGYLYFAGYLILVLVLLNIFVTIIVVGYNNSKESPGPGDEYNILAFLRDDCRYKRSKSKGRITNATLIDETNKALKGFRLRAGQDPLQPKINANYNRVGVNAHSMIEIHQLVDEASTLIQEKYRYSGDERHEQVLKVLGHYYYRFSDDTRPKTTIYDEFLTVVDEHQENVYCSVKRQDHIKTIVEYLINKNGVRTQESIEALKGLIQGQVDDVTRMRVLSEEMIHVLEQLLWDETRNKSTQVTFADLGLDFSIISDISGFSDLDESSDDIQLEFVDDNIVIYLNV